MENQGAQEAGNPPEVDNDNDPPDIDDDDISIAPSETYESPDETYELSDENKDYLEDDPDLSFDPTLSKEPDNHSDTNPVTTYGAMRD